MVAFVAYSVSCASPISTLPLTILKGCEDRDACEKAVERSEVPASRINTSRHVVKRYSGTTTTLFPCFVAIARIQDISEDIQMAGHSIMRYLIFMTLSFRIVLSFNPLSPAFRGPLSHHLGPLVSPTARYGIFDGFGDALKEAFGGAFDNAEYSAPPEGVKASARHILMKDEGLADKVKIQIESGESTWQQAAATHSTCPSRSQGGSLGSFAPGTMVPEFDAVIFDPKSDEGVVLGPVSTQFGFHLIVIDKRTGVVS